MKKYNYIYTHTRYKYEEMKNPRKKKQKKISNYMRQPLWCLRSQVFPFIIYLNNNP